MYNAIIYYNDYRKIEIELYLSGLGRDAPLGRRIVLFGSFDEKDIHELFERLEEDVETITSEKAIGRYQGLCLEIKSVNKV